MHYVGINLKYKLDDWNLFCLNVDNQDLSAELFINGESIFVFEDVSLQRNIKYIGNSKDGYNPFTSIKDLRIYTNNLQIEEMEQIMQEHTEMYIQRKQKEKENVFQAPESI